MIRCDNLDKSYRNRSRVVSCIAGLNLEIKKGEFLIIRGPSGCGKTTLLLTLGAMMRPTGGQVIFEKTDLYRLPPAARARLRRDHLGFVFQMFHLTPYLNIVENVLLPIDRAADAETRKRATQLLERLGLASRLTHKPADLSAGERQRAALARALINQPKLILADEPTGNLDPENGRQVLKHLSGFHRSGGTVVLVTHGEPGDQYADRVLRMKDGALQAAN